MNRFVDVLIVGSGVSGLYCALNLRSDLNVLVVCKGKIDCSNTYLAQGGISVARDEKDIPIYIEDTLRAGKYKNDLEAVKVLALESRVNIDKLIEMGIEFDRNEDGSLNYTKEGAHSINRIVHTKDNTGESTAKILIKNVKQKDNIKIYEETFFIDIIEKEERCIGAVLLKENEQINVYAKAVVLATGGIGGLYNNSTNQRILTGDGIVAAVKHNISLKDVNYIQIHPTAFYEEETNQRRFLISESLRGEGGILTNVNGERFVNELLPRDVVSQAVYEQMAETETPYVNLDIRFLGEDFIKNRFSTIYRECLKRGTDITKEYIKVSPAQHFFMGGIRVDLNSRTSMNNLYAVGETSCTGIHGANRLASNSLLEGLVFSRRAANFINNIVDSLEIEVSIVDKLNKSIEKVLRENTELAKAVIKEKGGILDDQLLSCR
ncbi:L-aspartate oxidase [Clostridium saccharoperbutylacetonicum]|uniref:L-aspartate oxidase n=1 Tax=Clostridium saccharoperbutylacetonicum N1-4(HMT) TaxID=931276 RepID=M1MIF4_9CLOT|nr:L-aspartate oxidase [Clostridium saccharoperbutylacetonicum]AGF54651.1 L-aspartate oxidase NadB [Clostridium saccharoperbutylacetonicum N1-4(HMT)]NRT58828.1 L-aspartate oxidase [Clostridium saccharoperbutylacetonicum]NSB28017.1 L-aspartate oxidase [Clostridium saccharoperbutylacetonicum]NSB41502.1 L-aspartate oxidase [Clostridium saccharoperbutylacetonicum]